MICIHCFIPCCQNKHVTHFRVTVENHSILDYEDWTDLHYNNMQESNVCPYDWKSILYYAIIPASPSAVERDAV